MKFEHSNEIVDISVHPTGINIAIAGGKKLLIFDIRSSKKPLF